jgi:hypothetical protein
MPDSGDRMTWFDIALICPVIFGIYYVQQIKIALKLRGEYVDLFGGWITDYRRFKQLTGSEKDEDTRTRYMAILNGLHLSLGFLALVVVLRLLGKM